MHELVEMRMPAALESGTVTGRATPSQVHRSARPRDRAHIMQKFVSRRLETWKAKVAFHPTSRLIDVVTISPALELALHFNLLPDIPATLQRLHIVRLADRDDDTPGDRALRCLLRGALHSALQESMGAERELLAALDRGARIAKGAYAHIRPLALLELATLGLRAQQAVETEFDDGLIASGWPQVLDAADRRLDELLRIGH
jgi:hypothetical protein